MITNVGQFAILLSSVESYLLDFLNDLNFLLIKLLEKFLIFDELLQRSFVIVTVGYVSEIAFVFGYQLVTLHDIVC